MIDHRRQPFVEVAADQTDLFGVLRELFLLPAVGHRPQEREQGHRRRRNHAQARGLFEQVRVVLEGRAEERLERQEQDDELRRRLELPPVLFAPEHADVLPDLPGVVFEPAVAFGV